MKWLRFEHAGRTGFGRLQDGSVLVHEGDLFGSPHATGEVLALADVAWRTPCQPSKIVALWNNFRAAAAKNGWAEPADPLYFFKAPSSAAGHGATVPVPAAYGGRVVFEGELAIVIGRRARAVTPADAHAHIFGYTCADDITAVELIHRDPSFPQWARAKSFDGFAVFGPLIETEFDPASATLRTLVGGRERQNYALSDMFFNPAELVSRISHDMTLEPGDLILCGTSLGALPMKPGSEVEVQIDGIGSLSHRYG
jgi:2-keto-4-pentenoate hydratase/2-oxohepta-3-ene-1,7-dioic acid hydratase in catechol pathway